MVQQLDPSDRPTVFAVKGHPFFAQVYYDELWLDQMPDIRTGLHSPLPVPTPRSSEGAWDDGFSPACSESDELFAAEDAPTDDEDLVAPRRRWLEKGGGTGTFSSGSGDTDESVSVRRGGRGLDSSAVDAGDGADKPERAVTAKRWGLSEKQELW